MFSEAFKIAAEFTRPVVISSRKVNGITPQGLGTPLMYALFLSVVTQWDPLVAIAFLIGMDARVQIEVATCILYNL